MTDQPEPKPVLIMKLEINIAKTSHNDIQSYGYGFFTPDENLKSQSRIKAIAYLEIIKKKLIDEEEQSPLNQNFKGEIKK